MANIISTLMWKATAVHRAVSSVTQAPAWGCAPVAHKCVLQPVPDKLRMHAAPEVMFNKRHYDGKKADVWSSGVMLYVMLFCTYPFGLPDDPQKQPEALSDFRERARTGQCR